MAIIVAALFCLPLVGASRSRILNVSAEVSLRSPTLAQLGRSTDSIYGHPNCPCIGLDNVAGNTEALIEDGDKVIMAKYPADLGGRCAPWDDGHHPLHCMPGQTPGQGNGWCAKSFCYVDPCNCAAEETPKLSIYVPYADSRARPVYYSYATCGETDEKTAMINKGACTLKNEIDCTAALHKCAWDFERHQCVGKAILEICDDPEFKPKQSVWGKDSCHCIGLHNTVGSTDVSIGGKVEKYPSDTGAICEAWDDGRNPECLGKDAPAWCKDKWCYVDPCFCDLGTPPKPSVYVPESNYRGRPIYYSYATCGAVDTWLESHPDAAKKVAKDADKLCEGVHSGAYVSTPFFFVGAVASLAVAMLE